MKEDRWFTLMFQGGELSQEEIHLGWHFCPDWDYLLINPDSSEWEACLCKKT